MTPRDWLLLLLATEGGPLDPVRLQKGMFLVAREARLPPRQRYWFVPYNYGPMSPAVYRDVERLVDARLAERVAAPGYSWTRIAVTPRGREEAGRVAAEVAPERLRALAAVKREITELGFSELLREIYRRYPEFAARSVFDRR